MLCVLKNANFCPNWAHEKYVIIFTVKKKGGLEWGCWAVDTNFDCHKGPFFMFDIFICTGQESMTDYVQVFRPGRVIHTQNITFTKDPGQNIRVRITHNLPSGKYQVTLYQYYIVSELQCTVLPCDQSTTPKFAKNKMTTSPYLAIKPWYVNIHHKEEGV